MLSQLQDLLADDHIMSSKVRKQAGKCSYGYLIDGAMGIKGKITIRKEDLNLSNLPELTDILEILCEVWCPESSSGEGEDRSYAKMNNQ